MITAVEVSRGQGTAFTFVLEDPSNGYALLDVTGLTPGVATLTSTSLAGIDGSVPQSSRRENRAITVTLELRPTVLYSVSELRQRLYTVLMPKMPVRLAFYQDDVADVVEIHGIVESAEPPIFSRNPGMIVTIVCNDVDFVDTIPTVVSGVLGTDLLVDYGGNVDTGFVYSLVVAGGTLNQLGFVITNPGYNDKRLELNATITPTRTLELNTQTRQKSALTRVSPSYLPDSVLYGITPASEWPTLSPGMNRVITWGDTALPMEFALSYRKRFGGL